MNKYCFVFRQNSDQQKNCLSKSSNKNMFPKIMLLLQYNCHFNLINLYLHWPDNLFCFILAIAIFTCLVAEGCFCFYIEALEIWDWLYYLFLNHQVPFSSISCYQQTLGFRRKCLHFSFNKMVSVFPGIGQTSDIKLNSTTARRTVYSPNLFL